MQAVFNISFRAICNLYIKVPMCLLYLCICIRVFRGERRARELQRKLKADKSALEMREWQMAVHASCIDVSCS